MEEKDIDSKDIIINDDSDMPAPETKDYNESEKKKNQEKFDSQTLVPTPKFIKLCNECLGKLPYSYILQGTDGNKIKLTELINYIETHSSMTVKNMNLLISFIANAPFEHVRPLMEVIENSERQSELWTIKK